MPLKTFSVPIHPYLRAALSVSGLTLLLTVFLPTAPSYAYQEDARSGYGTALPQVYLIKESSRHGSLSLRSLEQPSAAQITIRSLIRRIFGARYGWQAIVVALCESGLNPRAYNAASGAMGLFQFIPGTWRSTRYRYQNPFNAFYNTKAAYEVFRRDGYSWREWQCRP